MFLHQISIPSSIVSIESSAFRGRSSLKEIEIPFSVKSIQNYAFYGCSSLTKIFIPSSLDIIGSHIFPSKMVMIRTQNLYMMLEINTKKSHYWKIHSIKVIIIKLFFIIYYINIVVLVWEWEHFTLKKKKIELIIIVVLWFSPWIMNIFW